MMLPIHIRGGAGERVVVEFGLTDATPALTPALFNTLRWSKALLKDLSPHQRQVLLLSLCREEVERVQRGGV